MNEPIHASPLLITAMPVTLSNTQSSGLRKSGSMESQLPCAASRRSDTGSGQMSIRFQNAAWAAGSSAMFAALCPLLTYDSVWTCAVQKSPRFSPKRKRVVRANPPNHTSKKVLPALSA